MMITVVDADTSFPFESSVNNSNLGNHISNSPLGLRVDKSFQRKAKKERSV